MLKNNKKDNLPRGEKIEVDLNTLVPYVNLHGHQWRQEGPYLICDSCPVRHAVVIGMDKRLSGYDSDGSPIIEKV
jgi:hypothetical protein